MLTLIIVSFNSYQAIEACLGTVIESEQYDVVVVDNASTDQSAQILKKRYPFITVIELSQNIGYGRAANKALESVQTSHVFLLNPDLKADLSSIEALEKRMLTFDEDVALIAPAVTRDKHRQQGLLAVDCVSGAAMLFNMPALRKTGFFDENIFLFSEETDLCFRIKAAGLAIFLDSDVYIEHLHKQSSTPSPAIDYLKDWHFGWSRAYLYSKYGATSEKKSPAKALMSYGYKTLISTSSEKRKSYLAKFRGTLAFMRGENAFLEDGRAQASSGLGKLRG